MQAIEIVRVSKKFRQKGEYVHALNDVSLDIKKGEIFGLLGPNGAGKTTLINIISGLLLPDSGTVKVLGMRAEERKVLDRINFISSEGRFHWALSGLDILEFYGRVYGLSKGQRQERIKELAGFLGLDDILSRKYGVLSTGEKMRLGFAKALINRPEVLVMDEPTLGLDPNISIKVRKEIKRINRERKITMLLTSHYMLEVEQLADRVAFINKGRIVDSGSIESVKRKEFSTYRVILQLKKADSAFLKRNGFETRDGKVHKTLSAGQDISDVIAMLTGKGMRITDIRIKKPTLEDYFVKVLGEEVEDEA
ncbi:MAG: ABC transporter ATP-binding protein [Candidatus Aenigmarchaeota archaeon]|nr:ABC transporter ATP-binding protein [Candidatus Aenigmarchaeota archaeon]